MPGSPSGLKVNEQTSDSLTLDWNPPSQDGGSKIIGYNVEINDPGTNDWFPKNNSLIKGNSYSGTKA